MTHGLVKRETIRESEKPVDKSMSQAKPILQLKESNFILTC